MFDHVGIKVRSLGEGAAFYTAALAPLGHTVGYSDDSTVGIGPPDAPALWLYPTAQAAGPGTHIAFRARSREEVERFYQAALQAGARDNGPPGPRPRYSATYYAAFVIDPYGNNIEAMIS